MHLIQAPILEQALWLRKPKPQKSSTGEKGDGRQIAILVSMISDRRSHAMQILIQVTHFAQGHGKHPHR
jgi:hypothetical protein